MVSEWAHIMDKRPTDRTEADLEVIYNRLRCIEAFENCHPALLRQMCCFGYYEELDKGVTLFRQGDKGTNWYAVLAGSLDVQAQNQQEQDTLTLCTLGIGTAFGESILDNKPHSATVVTNEHCELLRIEQRDFRAIWEKNRRLMEDIVSPISTLRSLTSIQKPEENRTPHTNNRQFPFLAKKDSIDGSNPTLSITQEPSTALAKAGFILRTLILIQTPHLIRERQYHLRSFKRCMVGTEMVDWLLQQGGAQVRIHSRSQAIGMWQSLLEEGVIFHVTNEHQFKDKYLFYRFKEDTSDNVSHSPTSEEKTQAESELPETLTLLLQLAPDAIFRMILRKPLGERTVEDQEIIYEELLHIKALSHLSNSVKRELAGVLVFESHPKSGTVLFNQGDEGKSWYIILKGSVNVVIYGKGVVCSLHEGDDFGKLALVNDAPRAATITTRQNNCHFLRVDKEDFNNIIRDVEANTVRLKEHGQDVLLLQKIPTDGRTTDGTHSHYKYMVMAGTPQKMLEHLLETRIDQRNEEISDTFLEDFLLTHVIFMPSHQLCPELMRHYRIDVENCRQEKEFIVANKKRVLQFVQIWATVIRDAFFEDSSVETFLQELIDAVQADSKKYNLEEELSELLKIVEKRQKFDESLKRGSPQRWKVGPCGQIRQLAASESQDEVLLKFRKCIKGSDEVVFRVYCADHTYTTLKTSVGATAEMIKRGGAEKLGLKGELILVEVKSTGERVVFKDAEVSVPTGLSVNGRIFLTSMDKVETLTPLPEQNGPDEGTSVILENLNSLDIAYSMTMYEWELFTCVHEYELIYQVFGRHQFRKTMSNLDVFLRRFNEIQFWVVTEMVLASNLSRRVQLLRKFIKIASHCLEFQNLNGFFAIVMGLSNVAVSRLSQTWDRLPSKLRKSYGDFEAMIDPSRNHRRYRLAAAELCPPLIPFMPLLLKDMTFSHEGNKTYMEGLVNFEKMHMIAQTLRTIRHSRSQKLELDPPAGNKSQEVRNFIRNLRIIDNQKRLTQLSDAIEPRRP